ncbi:MAG: S8 family serine peptidase [Rhodothermales bacterium]
MANLYKTVVLLLVLSILPTRSYAQMATQAHVLEMADKARAAGSVRVIAVLDTASAAGKTSTVNRLMSLSLSDARVYENFPLVALEVDAAGLATLTGMSGVTAVQEDLPVPPVLAEATQIIGAQAAWAASKTGLNQTVAILDSGYNLNHVFYKARIREEACFSKNVAGVSTSICPNGQDTQTGTGSGAGCDPTTVGHGCLHGTGVTGVVIGKDNGSIGFNGVAKDAKATIITVFSNHGGGNVLAWPSDYIAALDYVYSRRTTYAIAAVNMSLGGGRYTNHDQCDAANAATKTAIDQLAAAGIATIIASGNNGYTKSISSPACISTAIAVGATTKDDAITSFSNHASMVKLLAPGQSITTSYDFTGGYSAVSGTSFSAPMTAGAWAVMRQAKPTATISQILNAFIDTGVMISGRSGVAPIPRIQLDAAIADLACGYDWKLYMTAKDKYKLENTFAIGQSTSNTNALDASCGESKLPPPPPSEVFHTSFLLPDGITYTNNDYRPAATVPQTWTLNISGGIPITFTWDPSRLSTGFYRMTDTETGAIVNVDLKATNTYRLVDKTTQTLTIQRFPAGSCVDFNVVKGWNMLSIPIDPLDNRIGALFNDKKASAFGYAGGYADALTLDQGKGYWFYSSKPKTFNVCGHTPGTNVPLVAGWNLIGGFDVDMKASTLTTSPGGLIQSAFYGYDNGYVEADSLKKGRAYWVKSSGAGNLVVQTGISGAPQQPIDRPVATLSRRRSVDSTWTELEIVDAAGQVQTLYLAPRTLEEDDAIAFLRPPMPPELTFDARFIDNAQVGILDAKADTVLLRGAAFPIRVTAHNLNSRRITLNDAARDVYAETLSEGKTITLAQPVSGLLLSAAAVASSTDDEGLLPIAYALEQSYPNPFSERTTIRFALPRAGHVALRVYDVLGREVEELVDAPMPAGYHEVVFDGSRAASGLYVYRIETDDYVAIRQMMRVR